MPAIFPNPLSSDGVDKFNYKWMATLMVVLAVVSFLVPLHPAYHPDPQDNSDKSSSSSTPGLLPSVQVACWCPEEFTNAYISYTNAYCANAFNSMIRGEDNEHIYEIRDPFLPIDYVSRGVRYVRKEFFAKQRKRLNVKDRANVKADVQKLVTYQTPVLLLVFGICLVLPHAIWAALSDCFSATFNVGRTLQNAERICSMEAASRQEAMRELSAGVAISVRASRMVLSALYLFKKLLSVLVGVSLILFLTQHAIPEADRLSDEISGKTKEHTVQGYNSGTNTSNADSSSPYNSFLCTFGIHMLQNVQRWSVQCQITRIGGKTAEERIAEMETSSNGDKNLLEFESTVLNVVVGLMVVLAISNVASLVNWLAKLVVLDSSSQPSLGLTGDIASCMDARLVVHMARINASPAVSHMLATRGSGHQGGCENVKLSEMEED